MNPIISLVFIVFAIQSTQAQNQTEASTTHIKEEVYKVVEHMPRFPACESKGLKGSDLNQCANTKMAMYIHKNIEYPKTALEKKTEGKAFVEFVVQKDGRLTDIKVIRDPGDGCGAEAVRVINKMGKEHLWIPGKLNDVAVNVLITLPIDFKL